MNKLELKNFRVFNKKVEFNISPITFLTGKNNSGKSSLLKSILLLSDFFNSETDQTVLSFNDANSYKHKINCFGNAKNWASKDKSLSLTFEHKEFRYEFVFSGQNVNDFAILDRFSLEALQIEEKIEIKWLTERTYEIKVPQSFFDYVVRPNQVNLFHEEEIIRQIDDIRDQIKTLNTRKRKEADNKKTVIQILSEKQSLQTRLKLLTEQVKSSSITKERSKPVFQISLEVDEDNISFITIPSLFRRGLSKYFERIEGIGIDNEFRSLMKFYDFLRMRLNLTTEHLSPNRFYQSRLYFKQSQISEINEVLFRYAVNKPKPGSEANRFLKYWLSHEGFGLGDDIKVEIIEGNSCKIEILKEEKLINVSDMGFGPGQLLTLLLSISDIINRKKTRVRQSRLPHFSNSIVLIEEPEANLHPMFQSKLADMFLEVQEKYGLNFIIETHSEYLIRKTQVHVKNIGKDHPFKVYYFDSEKGPFEMKYREDGIFENDFGSGFFDESANLTFELL